MWWSVQGGTVASVPSEEGLGWVPPPGAGPKHGTGRAVRGFQQTHDGSYGGCVDCVEGQFSDSMETQLHVVHGSTWFASGCS